MRLESGQTILHFRLVDKIGEGGMGEVWSAIDTQLDREVAIKALPAGFDRDPERIARLEREAKLLASLNHPNIAAIYGFPDFRPSSESGESIRFLAMERVTGEDLSQIIARGPLPIGDVADAARQIAGALEAAHDSGVVHRDLKPANVKRTPAGEFKVLDFGLAKALETEVPAVADGATVTSAGSVTGMILGTASYMSPEQARGQPVDRRTDLWAFGCLLYEMLTGTRAFEGATVTDVLAAVVTGEPDWDRLPAQTPVPMKRLLCRCLEKNPKKRLRDAGDASLLLDENPADARKTPVAQARPNRSLLVAMAVAALLAGAAIGWGIARRESGPAPPSSADFQRLTFARGMMRAARFATDGQTIVYGAAWDGPPVKLYLVRVDAPDSTPIALPPGELLAVSRTGEMAVSIGHAYGGWMGLGTLARTSLLGGSPGFRFDPRRRLGSRRKGNLVHGLRRPLLRAVRVRSGGTSAHRPFEHLGHRALRHCPRRARPARRPQSAASGAGPSRRLHRDTKPDHPRRIVDGSGDELRRPIGPGLEPADQGLRDLSGSLGPAGRDAAVVRRFDQHLAGRELGAGRRGRFQVPVPEPARRGPDPNDPRTRRDDLRRSADLASRR